MSVSHSTLEEEEEEENGHEEEHERDRRHTRATPFKCYDVREKEEESNIHEEERCLTDTESLSSSHEEEPADGAERETSESPHLSSNQSSEEISQKKKKR